MLWKIYSWGFIILTLIGMIVIVKDAPLVFADTLGAILNILLMIGVFVFAYNKKFLTNQVWKIIFWISIIFLIEGFLEVYILPKDFINNYLSFLQSKVVQSPTDVIFSWILGLPAIYAIYKMAFEKK